LGPVLIFWISYSLGFLVCVFGADESFSFLFVVREFCDLSIFVCVLFFDLFYFFVCSSCSRACLFCAEFCYVFCVFFYFLRLCSPVLLCVCFLFVFFDGLALRCPRSLFFGCLGVINSVSQQHDHDRVVYVYCFVTSIR